MGVLVVLQFALRVSVLASPTAARERKAQQSPPDPDAAPVPHDLFHLPALDGRRQPVAQDVQMHALGTVVGVLRTDPAAPAERPPAAAAPPRRGGAGRHSEPGK